MSTETLDKIKLAPYYDDFNANSNFHRILFKPGYPVQARELTQSQTILQDQITKFGDHIFAKNTPISGGQVTVDFNVEYVKLEVVNQNNIEIKASDFLGKTLTTNSANGVVAIVLATHEPEYLNPQSGNITDPPTLIVKYLSGTKFVVGDNIYSKTYSTDGLIAKVIAENSEYIPHRGNSSIASIDDGVFYINGFFVGVQKQTITIGEYTNTPNVRVGLEIQENIITSEDDYGLLDPALGSSNFQAPGADRYNINLTLVTKPLDDISDDQFFVDLITIDTGVIVKKVNRTIYSEIDDYLATRTFDTNGDFVINRFKLSVDQILNHDDVFYLKVGPGKAYVKGYLVENQSTLNIVSNKARSNNHISNKNVYIDQGNFLYTSNNNGLFDSSLFEPVEIHINQTDNSSELSTNTLAATAKIRAVEYVSGTTSDNYIFKNYLVDIETKSIQNLVCGSLSEDGSQIAFPDSMPMVDGLYNGVKGVINLQSIGTTKFEIASYVGGVATLTTKLPNKINISDTFSLIFDSSNFNSLWTSDRLKYCFVNNLSKNPTISTGKTFLSDAQKEELIVPIGEAYIKDNSITSTKYTSWQTFREKAFSTSVGTPLTLILPLSLGHNISYYTSGVTLTGVDIDSNFTFYTNSTSSVSSVLSASDNIESIVIDSTGTNARITAKSGAEILGKTINVVAKINVEDTADIAHRAIKGKDLILADTSALALSGTAVNDGNNDIAVVNLPRGQVTLYKNQFNANSQSLFVSDVKNIIKIIDNFGETANAAMLTNPKYDVTRNYILDNGQRDAYYDHATIKLLAGASGPVGDLIVLLNYYNQTGGDGYFCVDSYVSPVSNKPESYSRIPTYISKAGNEYNLRDCLDFRPARKNAVYDFELGTNNTDDVTRGVYTPYDNTNFELSYEYYLGRKDLLVVTKDNKINLIEGISAVVPKEPKEPDGAITIARVTHDPYTMFISNDNSPLSTSSLKIENVNHKRWRMEDITKLEDRVGRLEYYSSLSILEQSAKGLQIPDANGLNRFKSGILTNDFSTYKISDTSKIDYSASVNGVKQELLPVHDVKNFKLYLADTLNNFNQLTAADRNALPYSVDYDGINSYVTLKYSKVPAATQSFATRTINVNPFSFTNTQGQCILNPPMDNWVSTTKLPDLLIVNPDTQLYLQSDVINHLSTGAWQTISSSQKFAEGTATSLSKAVATGNWNAVTTMSSQDIINFISVYGQDTLPDGSTLGSKDYKHIVDVTTLDSDQAYLSYLRGIVGTFISRDGYWGSGVTQTTTSTSYKVTDTTQQRKDVSGYWTDLGNKYETNNGFVTDVSINPYIRGQEIEFVAADLLMSTGVDCYFDGKRVSDRIRLTNTLAVTTSTSNAFNNSEIIGYKSGDTYVPVGKILYSRYSGELSESNTTIKMLDVVWDINASKYTDDGYLYTLRLDKNGTVSGISATAGLQYYTHRSGRIQAASSSNYSVKLSQLASSVDGAYIGKTLNIILDDYQLDYPITGYDGATRTAYCNSSTVSPSVVNAVYSIKNYTGQMVTDDTGTISGIFYLPNNTFNVGQKIFRIDNRINGNIGSETTSAEATFYASGLSVQKQNLNFAPDISSANFTFTKTENQYLKTVDQSSVSANVTNFYSTYIAPPPPPQQPPPEPPPPIVDPAPPIDPPPPIVDPPPIIDPWGPPEFPPPEPYDPLCQTFMLFGENYPNGAFIKSVKLFFKTKPTDHNSPITVSLLGTVNGYPDGKTLDHSIVTLPPDKINLAGDDPHILDSTKYTEFEFPAPVYVKAETLYAIMIKTNSKQYSLYACKLGDVAIPSTAKNLPTDQNPTNPLKISQVPSIGGLFLSQNTLTWTADQNQTLMFELDRCEFETGSVSVEYVVPEKLPQRSIVDNYLTYIANTASIANANQYFASSTDVVIDAFNVTTTDLEFDSAKVSYAYKSTRYSNGVPAQESSFTSFHPGKYGTASYDDTSLDDNTGPRVLQHASNNSFVVQATLNTTDSKISPIISDAGLTLYGVKYRINNLELASKDITIINGGSGYSNTDQISISFADTINGGEDVIAYPTVDSTGSITGFTISSDTGNHANTISSSISITSTTGSGANLAIHGETSSIGGNSLFREISKSVTLEPGFDASDLNVYFTAYRPVNTDIYVYYKILNREDTQLFDDSDWQLMTMISGNKQYASQKTDLYEYVAAPGSNNTADTAVGYVSKSNGKAYTTFSQFAIKFVYRTSDSTFIPKIKEFRAIALV